TAGAPTTTNRSRSRSTRSTASRCEARAGSRPSHPGPTRAGCDSPTDAPAAAATTGRPAPTTNPASASRHRSRPDPSKPPSLMSATRSDFATAGRVPAYRDRPLERRGWFAAHAGGAAAFLVELVLPEAVEVVLRVPRLDRKEDDRDEVQHEA